MKKWELDRILVALGRLPIEEQRAARQAMLRLGMGRGKRGTVPRSRAIECAGEIIKTAARGHAKRASDHETDHARRVLVGARVPRAEADRYRAAAAAAGLSLYAWTRAALQRAENRQGPPGCARLAPAKTVKLRPARRAAAPCRRRGVLATSPLPGSAGAARLRPARRAAAACKRRKAE